MHTEMVTTSRPSHAPGFWTGQGAPRRPVEVPSLPRERAWRRFPGDVDDSPAEADIVASRWVDERAMARVERSVAPAGRYVIAVALRPVRIKLGRGTGTAYEGVMPTGTVHVAEPGQAVEAEFFTPCDFVHFHVAAGIVHGRQAAATLQQGSGESVGRNLRDLLVRDELAAQLSRTLVDDQDGSDPLYVQSIGQTILMRILALRPPASRVGALPKWRLRRVQEHLAANISEPISLSDLAGVAGLSRMHFAAQFRVATGCRPHDYLLQQRIEQAKHLLANTDTTLVEVALSVGFQTQSHFSTVFKRLAGDTPGRWQRNQHAGL